MLQIFNDKMELANKFCEELIDLVQKKEKICLALSGGSTPKIILQTLAAEYKYKIDWKKVHLFWGDERCLPPGHEESNFGMTKKFLLDKIDMPVENIHRIKGEVNPDGEAERYSNEIKKNVPFRNNLPLFDLVMLGLGEDGHTASIFPDQMNLLDSDKFCEVAVHPESGQKRITLTGKTINNAERIIFFVTGESKAKIVKEIFEGNKKNQYPAFHIKSAYGRTEYFIDKEAAKLLK